jgi:hypothetical protein
MVYHRVGQRSGNVGIVSLDLRANPENPAQRAVFTAVANASGEERRTELELRFDGQLVESKTLVLPPTNTVPVVFITGQDRDGVFTVRVAASDDLAVDNEASVLSRLPQPVRVLLVTRGNRFLEKALRTAGLVELRVAAGLAGSLGDADVVVLDGVVPGEWPRANVLAFQVADTNWFSGVTTVEAPPVVDWRSAHPLLRFVSLDNVQVARALAVTAPDWAVRLVDAPQTPLVLAGELGRQRAVWVGFDVLESTWPLRVSFPIFIANAVDWLNPASIRSAQQLVRAGEPFRLTLEASGSQGELELPDGSRQAVNLDPAAAEWVYGDTIRQGTYTLRVGTNATPFVVNLLDSSETDTRPREELDFGRFGSVAPTTTRRASLELWRWVVAAALGVLLFEWWFYHRRTA